jgi:hypothetical protein
MMRIGVVEGIHVLLRSGISLDHQVGFAFFEGSAQFPVQPEWAIRVAAAWAAAGNIEVRGGVRLWLTGRGGAGSIGITVDGGFGYMHYSPPARDRGFPPPVELMGPGVGIGIEARL